MAEVATSDDAGRTFVKICGITNREDAHVAIESGADALGFIGVQESPRYVSAMAFHRIKDVLPGNIPLVVVVKRVGDAEKYDCDAIQFYEPSSAETADALGKKLISVVRVHDAEDIASFPDNVPHFDAILLDAVHATVLGGSGTRFEWELAQELRDRSRKPFLLAGGLTPSNVERALELVRPYGVDVSSGVEDKTPGAKDHKLIELFVKNVREWDAANPATGVSKVPTLHQLFAKPID